MRIQDLFGRHKIDIPGNGISRSGRDAIQRKMLDWGLGMIPEDKPLPPSKTEYWKWEWKVGGAGEYVGTLPKRLAKLVHKTKGLKLTPEHRRSTSQCPQ